MDLLRNSSVAVHGDDLRSTDQSAAPVSPRLATEVCPLRAGPPRRLASPNLRRLFRRSFRPLRLNTRCFRRDSTTRGGRW